ncbi:MULTISPECIES: hypothetical protein [unclassified Bradyrhizobium]|uniref:hypothetical protein n=1 Tax=unclassified Bradyrhizobium TaxID=2631580 RepID=UPI0028F11AC2|nr:MULTISPECIES: hypothetical protein [unclassified Bradyrhizobium]
MSNQKRETLTISPDGRFLLDATGKPVRQFVERVRSFGPMTATIGGGVEIDPVAVLEKGQFGQGFNIHPCKFRKECIGWDANGNCTQWITTHDICYDDPE